MSRTWIGLGDADGLGALASTARTSASDRGDGAVVGSAAKPMPANVHTIMRTNDRAMTTSRGCRGGYRAAAATDTAGRIFVDTSDIKTKMRGHAVRRSSP